jgi:hypothetical protein
MGLDTQQIRNPDCGNHSHSPYLTMEVDCVYNERFLWKRKEKSLLWGRKVTDETKKRQSMRQKKGNRCHKKR